jgi:hypothetical protein
MWCEEGENLRGQNPRRALAGRFGVTAIRICVALYREIISGMLGHFYIHPFGDEVGVAESIREAEAREGWLFGTRIKALKGEPGGGFGLKDGHSLGCPIK